MPATWGTRGQLAGGTSEKFKAISVSEKRLRQIGYVRRIRASRSSLTISIANWPPLLHVFERRQTVKDPV